MWLRETEYTMLNSSALDDLVREQESLRLRSLRYLEELRIRQDKYRSCRNSGHRSPKHPIVSNCCELGSANASLSENVLCSGEGEMLVDGNELRYRPVSTVIKSASLQEFDSVLNAGLAASQILQPSDDGQKHITVCQSTSAVLSDDLHCEQWSALATQSARKKLVSGRTLTQANLNNSSSMDSHRQTRLFEPVLVSSECADSYGSKPLELDTNTAGYFSSGDASPGRHDCTGTPQKMEQSLEGTPKSILRHRQIIDRNVHVESKFDHTPTANVRSRRHRRGLNFSYSDVNDAQLFGRKTKSVNFDVDSEKSTSKSNAQATEFSSEPAEFKDQTQVKTLTSLSLAGDSLPSSERFYYAPNATDSSENSTVTTGSSAARKIASDGLLLHTGNDRQNAKIVRELESRSPSNLFSSDQPLETVTSASISRSQVSDFSYHTFFFVVIYNLKLVLLLLLKNSFRLLCLVF